MIGVPVLDGHFDRLLEGDRALDVPAVKAIAPADSLPGVGDMRRAVVLVGERLAAKVPRAVVVVLGAGSVDGGQLVAIDEDHVVALAEPPVLVLLDGMRDTHKMTAPRRFHEDIIVRAIEVLLVAHRIVPVVLPVVGPALAGGGLAILRVKAAHIGGQRGQCHIIHRKVKIVGADFSFVGQRNFRRTRKRHLEIGVQRLDGSHGQQRRLIGKVLAKPEAVEIADGDLDRRRRFAVPPGAQNEIFQVQLIVGVDGEPDVRDHAGAGYIEQSSRAARLHGHRVAVPAGAVPAR